MKIIKKHFVHTDESYVALIKHSSETNNYFKENQIGFEVACSWDCPKTPAPWGYFNDYQDAVEYFDELVGDFNNV